MIWLSIAAALLEAATVRMLAGSLAALLALCGLIPYVLLVPLPPVCAFLLALIGLAMVRLPALMILGIICGLAVSRALAVGSIQPDARWCLGAVSVCWLAIGLHRRQGPVVAINAIPLLGLVAGSNALAGFFWLPALTALVVIAGRGYRQKRVT